MLKLYSIYTVTISAIIYFSIQENYVLASFILFVHLSVIAAGVFNIQLNLFIRSLNHFRNLDSNFVALTFDDGPHPEFTPKVLDTLAQFNAKATFFLIGSNAEKYPEIVNRIVREGHSIGNHTYSHSNSLPVKSSSFISKELLRTNKVLKEITGKDILLFRPPFGVTNPKIYRALKKTQLTSIGWSVRTYDTAIQNPDKITTNATRTTKAGDIILMHDTKKQSNDALIKIIPIILDRGMTFATVETLKNLKK